MISKNYNETNFNKVEMVALTNEEVNAVKNYVGFINETRENENLSEEERERKIREFKEDEKNNPYLLSARYKMEHYNIANGEETLCDEMADAPTDDEKEVVMDKVKMIVGNGGFHTGTGDLEMYIADVAGAQVSIKDFGRMVQDAIDDLTTYIRLEYGVWITPKGELLVSENKYGEKEKAIAESADLRTLLDYIKNTPIEDLSWRNVLEVLSKKRKNVKEMEFKDEVYFKMMMDIETYAPEATPENPERKLTFEAIGFSHKSLSEIHKLLSK